MSRQYNLISQLSTSRTNWVLKARVTRMWDVFAFNKPSFSATEVTGVELLLIDEEGNQIVASLHKRFAAKFTPFLVEGGLYTVTTFLVRQAKPQYRVAPNDLAITCLHSTVIRAFPEEDFTVPFYKFDIVSFEHLYQRLGVTDKLTDIVGRLASTTKIDFVGSTGTLKRRVIQLEDSTYHRREVALLGNKADLITDADMDSAPVLVVTSLLINSWNGNMSASSTSATRIFRDVDIPEIEAFSSRATGSLGSVQVVDTFSRFLTYGDLADKKRTIDELIVYCGQESRTEAIYYVFAEITNIYLEKGWNYPACTDHMKKISILDNKFHCELCNGEPNKTCLRYRLEIEVQDSTSLTTFTLFDKEAQRLLNISAEQLSLELPNPENGDSLPEPMAKLNGREFLFCVKLTEFNFTSSPGSFTVLKTYNMHEVPKEVLPAAHIDGVARTDPAVPVQPVLATADPPATDIDGVASTALASPEQPILPLAEPPAPEGEAAAHPPLPHLEGGHEPKKAKLCGTSTNSAPPSTRGAVDARVTRTTAKDKNF